MKQTSQFDEELPGLVRQIENILPDGDVNLIDNVLERLRMYGHLDDEQNKIVQNLSDALSLRVILSPADYLKNVVCERRRGKGLVYEGKLGNKQVAVKEFRPVEPPDIERFKEQKFVNQSLISFHGELMLWGRVSSFNLDYLWPLYGYTTWVDHNEMVVVFALVSPLAESNLRLSYKEYRGLEPKMFANYFHDAARGLQSLHLHSVIHGNIHPGNILRSGNHCYLTEFSGSKHVDFSSSFSFASASAVANAQGIPELLDGSVKQRDKYTDVFSFGSTMYEVLVGKSLVITTGPLKRPLNRTNREWTGIWNLISSCVSSTPSDRPTADGLVESLVAILKS